MQLSHMVVTAITIAFLSSTTFAQTRFALSPDELAAAVARHRAIGPAQPIDQHTVIAEGETFEILGNAPGWKPIPWGENYYAATFALTFLSRKACLSAPPSCAASVAQRVVTIPEAGRYRVLARYESPYRFETAFRLVVEQNGKTILDREYGKVANEKIWAFRQGIKTQVQWGWGAVENTVWEGHDTFADLQPGEATIRLIAAEQTQPAAKRNVDVIMLTKDDAEFDRQMEKARYLPLDGMLTQQGELQMRVTNHGSAALKLTLNNGREHSPYWVHIRRWKPRAVTVEPGATSEWLEVGDLLDAVNDGQWDIKTAGDDSPHYNLTFKTPGASKPIASFDVTTPTIQLAYDGDTRYTHRIRTSDQVLYDLVAELKALPIRGKAPSQTPIYYYTFDVRPDDARYTAALAEFATLMGLPPADPGITQGFSRPASYLETRHLKGDRLGEHLEQMKADGTADTIRVVSLGDEITLPAPGADADTKFVEYLKAEGVTPAEIGAADWADVHLDLKLKKGSEKLYYHSVTFREDYGIESIKERTDLLRKYLPGAGIGANFSPHHGVHYLGETYQWITTFRRDGMTMPWSEDYIWQVPVGTPQMNAIILAQFRAGLKGKADPDFHFYVMPHAPGNTPAMWRRLFYQAIGGGANIINLFEFRPVQAAYTENHVSDINTYQAVRVGFHELGLFEDIVQSGNVRQGDAAMWFSRVGDMYHNGAAPFAAAKRTLFIAARLQQLQVDVAAEEDATDGTLDQYKLLFVSDRNLHRDHAAGIAAWVKRGGTLVVTAGAATHDQFDQPYDPFNLGDRHLELLDHEVTFAKQDLPFVNAERVDGVPIIGAREKRGDGSLISHAAQGEGRVYHMGFLPGLSLFKPAMPMSPPDRGSSDDASAHFMPSDFDPATMAMLADVTRNTPRAVVTSDPLVAAHVIESPKGAAVVLINWQRTPVKNLTVTLNFDAPGQSAQCASGEKVTRNADGSYTLDLTIADALLLR